MNTLQKRLRANPLPLPGVMELCREAADRIDMLELIRDEYKMAAEAEARFADQYKAENAALRADAERYRWLCEPRTWPESVNAALDCGNKVVIDDAIDAARSKT